MKNTPFIETKQPKLFHLRRAEPTSSKYVENNHKWFPAVVGINISCTTQSKKRTRTSASAERENGRKEKLLTVITVRKTFLVMKRKISAKNPDVNPDLRRRSPKCQNYIHVH